MELLNKKILITGGSGFIGLNVVKAFTEGGVDVFVLVHKSLPDELKENNHVTLVYGNVADEFDIVIHIAGLASDIGPEYLFKEVNFDSVKMFSKLAKEKFVYISSTDVYGIKDFYGEDEETLPLAEHPINPYPKYKIESEKWLRKNSNNYVIIRPAAVWGEGDKTLEPRAVEFLRTSPYIVHFGKWKGKNRWPLADVKSLAQVVYKVCKTDEYNLQAINIIDEKVTTMDEYYRQLVAKYFPDRKFYTVTLPMWVGYSVGWVSTTLSNMMGMTCPLFDPSLYAAHHISSNLDFSGAKMKRILEKD